MHPIPNVAPLHMQREQAVIAWFPNLLILKFIRTSNHPAIQMIIHPLIPLTKYPNIHPSGHQMHPIPHVARFHMQREHPVGTLQSLRKYLRKHERKHFR